MAPERKHEEISQIKNAFNFMLRLCRLILLVGRNLFIEFIEAPERAFRIVALLPPSRSVLLRAACPWQPVRRAISDRRTGSPILPPDRLRCVRRPPRSHQQSHGSIRCLGTKGDCPPPWPPPARDGCRQFHRQRRNR